MNKRSFSMLGLLYLVIQTTMIVLNCSGKIKWKWRVVLIPTFAVILLACYALFECYRMGLN